MNYHLSPVTKNIKLGVMATSISAKKTCPDSCGLKDNGCYGQVGPVNFIWNKVSDGRLGMRFDAFIAAIKKLPRYFAYRYGQVGDLPGDNLKIDSVKLDQLIDAVKHLRAYAYTHKPVLKGKANSQTLKKNRELIAKANKNGFTINISCDGIGQVDQAIKLGIGPVVTVLPENAPETQFTKGGAKVIVCPAQTRELTCAQCMLCQKQRSVVVGFRVHGTGKRKAECAIDNG